jgi:hypothetical protein
MTVKIKFDYKTLPDLTILNAHGWDSIEPGLYKSGDVNVENIGDVLYEVKDTLVYIMRWNGHTWKLRGDMQDCFRRSVGIRSDDHE